MNIINAPNAATNSLADTLVLVETTNFIPRENTAFISFSQTSEFPKKGDSFTLEWLGYVIVFTFDSSKNELYFLPHYENGDKGTYIAIVTERLQQHDLVLDFFRIESNNNRIFFYFLNNEDLAKLTKSQSATFQFNGFPNAKSTKFNNLKGVLRLFDATTKKPISVAMEVIYDNNYRAVFNLKHAFDDLKLHFPTTFFGVEDNVKICNGSFLQYYFRYADKYGSPLVSEHFVKSDIYTVFYGETLTPTTYEKEVSIEQPDFLYWKNTEIDNVFLGVKMYYSDGSTNTYHIAEYSTPRNKMYYFLAGYEQLGLEKYNRSYSKEGYKEVALLGYEVQLQYTSGVPFLTRYYRLAHQNEPNEMILLVETDYGGVETLRMKGKKIAELEVEREAIQKYTGEFAVSNVRLKSKWEVNTGYYESATELSRLASALKKDFWLIDTEKQTIKACISETKSIPLIDETKQLHDFTFKFMET